MSRLKGAMLCVAAATLISTPGHAQITGHPIEVSADAGYFHYDIRAYTRDAPGYGSSVGVRLASFATFEGWGIFSSSKAVANPPPPLTYTGEPNRSFYWLGGDLRWNLRSGEGRALPFVTTGMGYGHSHWDGDPNPDVSRGSPSIGAGLLINLRSQRSFLRFQARDIMYQERYQSGLLNHIVLTAGFHYLFGGHERDIDHDGVRDWLDKCPDTPIGAKVDANGCPIDSDHDGVYDGLDKCPNTPAGCKIDANGCPIDSDGDGVCDGIDKCPDTPKGATVDAQGCPHDEDGDGVWDGIDQCPGTPRGCTVDARGCPADADSDGVCDGVDRCPNTPPGVKVDAYGCPIEITWMERQLLDVGVIRSRTRYFATGKSTLDSSSAPTLDSLAVILSQYPDLKLEIGGHTDNVGSAAKNQTLSDARAKTLLDYFTRKHPKIAANMTAKGYGMSQPVAPNSTAKGRGMNRRVELKVLNPEALQIERERRRYLLRGESAPPKVNAPANPDTTRR